MPEPPPTPHNDLDRTSNASPSPPLPPGVPARIGRYEVRKVLGEGACGRVYLAFDPELGREVAIKVPLAAVLTPELRERFLREGRATARIRHANVCPILDVGTDKKVPFLVMQFVPGGTLEDVLKKRRKPYSGRDAVAIVRKLALGVAAAHAQGVLHRDLKPANVLWDEEAAEVLLTDFGLARVADAARLSESGRAVGTPLYMSPEQFRGRSAEVGPPADVYSLGVILYELVTGDVPIRGETFWEVMTKVATEEPRPPSEACPGIDLRIDALCATAMAKKAAERYPSAKALADALAEIDTTKPARERDEVERRQREDEEVAAENAFRESTPGKQPQAEADTVKTTQGVAPERSRLFGRVALVVMAPVGLVFAIWFTAKAVEFWGVRTSTTDKDTNTGSTTPTDSQVVGVVHPDRVIVTCSHHGHDTDAS